MFLAQDEPVLETGFTASDIEDLLQSDLILHSSNNNNNSGSSEEYSSTRAVYSVEERKRRRMLLNRESARRSRWRKKRQLENLREEMKRLGVENRELKNRLKFALQHCDVALRENDELTSEYVALWTRLSDVYQTLGSVHVHAELQMI